MKYIRTNQATLRSLFFIAPVIALTIPLFFLAPTGGTISLAVFLLAFVSLLSLPHLRMRAVEITLSAIIVTRSYGRELTEIVQSRDILKISGIASGGWRIKKTDGKGISVGLMCFSRTDREAIARQITTLFADRNTKEAEPTLRE